MKTSFNSRCITFKTPLDRFLRVLYTDNVATVIMALSKSVEESLNEASGQLRNALAFAARQERPVVCTQIAKLINDIENIGSMDSILDTLDEKIAELDDD